MPVFLLLLNLYYIQQTNYFNLKFFSHGILTFHLPFKLVLHKTMAAIIVFGSQNLSLELHYKMYWAVVVDRTNLNVLLNFTFTDNQSVPSQLTPI